MFANKFNTRNLVMISLFIAMQVVLTRFFSIQTPFVRIGFNFLPLALCSIMFGPVTGGIAAALADITGMMLFPTGGTFFIGYTLSAFLAGVVYGAVVKVMGIKPLSIFIASSVVCIGLNLFLNTYWLSVITGQGYLAYIPARVLKNLVMIPIQAASITAVWQLVKIRYGRIYEGIS